MNNYEIYKTNSDNTWRFTLGRNGARKIIIIGLNPSIATKEKSDATITKVENVAKKNQFDGFIMLNLYPVRNTYSSDLPIDKDQKAYSENLKCIESIVSKNSDPVIWAAWGGDIFKRSYFSEAAIELFDRLEKYKIDWKHFGTLTKSGHPRHPSRLRRIWQFESFDIKSYSEILNR